MTEVAKPQTHRQTRLPTASIQQIFGAAGDATQPLTTMEEIDAKSFAKKHSIITGIIVITLITIFLVGLGHIKGDDFLMVAIGGGGLVGMSMIGINPLQVLMQFLKESGNAISGLFGGK